MILYDKNVQNRTGTKCTMYQMEAGDNLKKIGEVFNDYKTNSNIVDAEITKLNLLKKINTLEIGME